MVKDFKVEPFKRDAREENASSNAGASSLSGKSQLLFEIPTRHLLKRTNVKLKKMLDLVLEHSACEATLIANGLLPPGQRELATPVDKKGSKESKSKISNSDDFEIQPAIDKMIEVN